MRGAIESAALAAWQALACRTQSTSLADVSDPPQISPQCPRAFRPARVMADLMILLKLWPVKHLSDKNRAGWKLSRT